MQTLIRTLTDQPTVGGMLAGLEVIKDRWKGSADDWREILEKLCFVVGKGLHRGEPVGGVWELLNVRPATRDSMKAEVWLADGAKEPIAFEELAKARVIPLYQSEVGSVPPTDAIAIFLEKSDGNPTFIFCNLTFHDGPSGRWVSAVTLRRCTNDYFLDWCMAQNNHAALAQKMIETVAAYLLVHLHTMGDRIKKMTGRVTRMTEVLLQVTALRAFLGGMGK